MRREDTLDPQEEGAWAGPLYIFLLNSRPNFNDSIHSQCEEITIKII